jgi:hypothetical protein
MSVGVVIHSFCICDRNELRHRTSSENAKFTHDLIMNFDTSLQEWAYSTVQVANDSHERKKTEEGFHHQLLKEGGRRKEMYNDDPRR